jgi:hypothetical protein
MQATAVTQATTEALATSNSKDDSNIMAAHNSRNTSNSRNENDNRTANTVWMAAKAGIRDDSSGRDNSIIIDVISSGTTRIASREDSNIQRGHQQQ